MPLVMTSTSQPRSASDSASDSSNDEAGDSDSTTSDSDTEGEDYGDPCAPSDEPVDEANCAPLETDYPGADIYPACISDGGSYELYADPPGSIARIEAGDAIAALLEVDGRTYVAGVSSYSKHVDRDLAEIMRRSGSFSR